MSAERNTMLDLMDGSTLLETAIGELQRQLVPEDRRYERKESRGGIRLSDFVETTSRVQLDDWQRHMCARLEKLKYQRGQRILLHAPPQHGKSIIVSQRLPAYLIGFDPAIRVKVACYNIEKATDHVKVCKGLMQGADYISIFPDADTRIPSRCRDDIFSTRGRRSFKDGQPSIKALGLQSGFTGEGAETLIIDDPYASGEDAKSEAVARKIRSFWKVDCKSRISDDDNVVIMFHRYNEDDFIGELIREEGLQSQGGVWELITYRCEWDGDERLEVGGKDPLKRKMGEYLSKRMARKTGNFREKKKDPAEWLALFQGKPSKVDGNFFLVNNLRVIPRVPKEVKLIKACRAWDLASTEDGDWTVGVLMALGDNGYIYVLDVVRVRKTTDARNKVIRSTAKKDRSYWSRFCEDEIKTRMPQDPNQAGKDQVLAMRKLLVGFDVIFVSVSGKGDKETRADPWSQYVNTGLVRLVYDGNIHERDDDGEYISWVPDYVEEHRRFPGSSTTKKDQVDASSDAYAEVGLEIDTAPGQSFDTLGLWSEDITPEAELLRELYQNSDTQDDLIEEYLSSLEFEEDPYGYNPIDDGYRTERSTPVSGQKRRRFPTRPSTYSTRREAKDALKAPSWRQGLKRSDRNRSSRGNKQLSQYSSV